MKERIKTLKTLIIGILIGALLVPTAFATVATVTKEIFYNDIKITLDGSALTPTDASGNYVEPFIMDGTTYLPVRGVANALGLGIEWDGATNTVKLSSDKADAPVAGATVKPGDVIYDAEGVKVTFTETKEYTNGIEIKFLVENLADTVISFRGSDVSANDFMVSYTDIYSDLVQPGKKATARVLIDDRIDIDKLEKLEFNTEVEFYKDGNSFSPFKETEGKVIMNFE